MRRAWLRIDARRLAHARIRLHLHTHARFAALSNVPLNPPSPTASSLVTPSQDVVEVMAPTYTMGLHVVDTSTKWTTSDVMCYLDGF